LITAAKVGNYFLPGKFILPTGRFLQQKTSIKAHFFTILFGALLSFA
jgi:hypothetical protein